jgi:dihydrofolate synthase/folylpolyglutamate synthase
MRGDDWDAAVYDGALHFRDSAGRVSLPLPRLPGAHQVDNAALAVAMLRAQDVLPVNEAALKAGMGWAEWPARLQRLDRGPLLARLPAGSEIWVDGGHNPPAGKAIAAHFDAALLAGRPLLMVVGMLGSKDADGFLKPFVGVADTLRTVPIDGHAHHAPDDLAAMARDMGLKASASADLGSAMAANEPVVVLITGSLYLAGEALAENGQNAG